MPEFKITKPPINIRRDAYLYCSPVVRCWRQVAENGESNGSGSTRCGNRGYIASGLGRQRRVPYHRLRTLGQVRIQPPSRT